MEVFKFIDELGYREIHMIMEVLDQYMEGNYPTEEFADERVSIHYNDYSDNVYITNYYDQTLMLDEDNKLEILHILPYSGQEGFKKDLLLLDFSELENEDIEYIKEL